MSEDLDTNYKHRMTLNYPERRRCSPSHSPERRPQGSPLVRRACRTSAHTRPDSLCARPGRVAETRRLGLLSFTDPPKQHYKSTWGVVPVIFAQLCVPGLYTASNVKCSKTQQVHSKWMYEVFYIGRTHFVYCIAALPPCDPLWN